MKRSLIRINSHETVSKLNKGFDIIYFPHQLHSNIICWFLITDIHTLVKSMATNTNLHQDSHCWKDLFTKSLVIKSTDPLISKYKMTTKVSDKGWYKIFQIRYWDRYNWLSRYFKARISKWLGSLCFSRKHVWNNGNLSLCNHYYLEIDFHNNVTCTVVSTWIRASHWSNLIYDLAFHNVIMKSVIPVGYLIWIIIWLLWSFRISTQ